MAWVKIDDQFADHPKAAMAGPLGIAMQVAALCYANRYLTDGFIPCAVAPRLLDLTDLAEEMWDAKNPDDSHVEAYRIDHTWVIDKMVKSGLWEDVHGGWQIHDYLDYNPSRADTLAKRAADLERKKTPQRPPASSARNPNGIPADSKRPVPDPVPDPVEEKKVIAVAEVGGVGGTTPTPLPPRPPKRADARPTLPSAEQLVDDLREWADEKGVRDILADEVDRFRDYCLSGKNGKPVTYADYAAACRKWITNPNYGHGARAPTLTGPNGSYPTPQPKRTANNIEVLRRAF